MLQEIEDVVQVTEEIKGMELTSENVELVSSRLVLSICRELMQR